MSTRWLILVAALLVPFTLISTVSETASAQLPSKKQRQQQAKEAYTSGKAKMDAGDYRGALMDFQLADTSWPGAAPKYNIAYCHDQLGNKTEAVAAYRTFINSNPGAKYADRVALANQRIQAIESEQKASATGRVMFTVNPPIAGITISVDGQPVVDNEAKLAPGPHQVEAAAPGYAPFRQQIEVVGGTQLEVPITMQVAVAATPRKSSKGKPLIIAGFVVGGVGVVSGVLMTVFGVMALGSASDFEKTPTTELADDTDRNGLIADVFLPFTVVGLGAGAVLLGIGYSQKTSTGSLSVTPMTAAGGGGVQLTVDF